MQHLIYAFSSKLIAQEALHQPYSVGVTTAWSTSSVTSRIRNSAMLLRPREALTWRLLTKLYKIREKHFSDQRANAELHINLGEVVYCRICHLIESITGFHCSRHQK